MSALILQLARTRPDWATMLETPTHSLGRALSVRCRREFSSGRPWEISLWIYQRPTLQGAGEDLAVKELEPGTVVPAFCPERHIVADGSFCLGWGTSAPPTPRNETTARAWWEQLGGYLHLQMTAERTGCWRRGMAWAHGHEAAYLHAQLLQMIEALPAPIQFDPLDVNLPGLRSSWSRRTAAGPCPCGSGQPSGTCHQPVMRSAVELTAKMQAAEGRWLAAFADRPCCETMMHCPLRGRGVPRRSR